MFELSSSRRKNSGISPRGRACCAYEKRTDRTVRRSLHLRARGRHGLAATGGFAAIRSDVATQVDTIVGPAGAARVRPFVDDATARIESAVRTVASTDRPPRRILTASQKLALVRARASGSEPDLQLSAEQRDALRIYARDAARGILPIVREDGAKIQQTLSPAQIAALEDLRAKTVERLEANAPAGTILPDEASLLANGGDLLSPGAFVLVVDLDVQRIVRDSR